MNRISIAPGAYITTLPGERFKRCKTAVHLIVPSRRDNATALALLPHLLERRCAEIPDPMQLSRKLFSLYGAELSTDSYVAGERRIVTVALGGLKSEYALAGEDLEGEYLHLLSQILFAPKLRGAAFEEEDLEIEKQKHREYLKSERNDKRTYVLRQARRKLFGSSPMGIESSGYLEDIEKITPEEMYRVWRALLQEATIEVVAVGTDGALAGRALAEKLAELDRSLPETSNPRAPISEGARSFAEPMDTEQGKLCLLYTSGQLPDARAGVIMRMASALLGGLPTSRLFMHVREEQSLCYYCAATYSPFTGVLSIDSGVEHEQCSRAADAIRHELHMMQNETVSDEEMMQAKKALKSAFVSAADTPDFLSSWAFNERLRGTDLTLSEFLDLVESVTPEEVQRALSGFTEAVEYAITRKEAAE